MELYKKENKYKLPFWGGEHESTGWIHHEGVWVTTTYILEEYSVQYIRDNLLGQEIRHNKIDTLVIDEKNKNISGVPFNVFGGEFGDATSPFNGHSETSLRSKFNEGLVTYATSAWREDETEGIVIDSTGYAAYDSSDLEFVESEMLFKDSLGDVKVLTTDIETRADELIVGTNYNIEDGVAAPIEE